MLLRKLDLADATAPLAEYARLAHRQTVVVFGRGRPLAAVVPVAAKDWEDFVVGQDRGFLDVMARSVRGSETEGASAREGLQREQGRPSRTTGKGRTGGRRSGAAGR